MRRKFLKNSKMFFCSHVFNYAILLNKMQNIKPKEKGHRNIISWKMIISSFSFFLKILEIIVNAIAAVHIFLTFMNSFS